MHETINKVNALPNYDGARVFKAKPPQKETEKFPQIFHSLLCVRRTVK